LLRVGCVVFYESIEAAFHGQMLLCMPLMFLCNLCFAVLTQ